MKLVSLRSNKPHFRSVGFRDGLNVVVAERVESAKDTDSRNGVGKTTLFRIIDFCFGGRVSEGDSLHKIEGDGWEFTLTVSLHGRDRISVTRALDCPRVIRISGDTHVLNLGQVSPGEIGVNTWTSWLGRQCFDLPADAESDKYGPTFRRLVGHFLRFKADAYVSPFETFGKQPPHQVQADNAFLLGLDWRLATEWQRWKDRNRAFGLLSKKELDDLGERLGELESQRVRAAVRHRRLSDQIKKFDVLPEYREVEQRVSNLTGRMQTLANAATLNARLIELYQGQLVTEHSDNTDGIMSVFTDAGIILGDALIRSVGEIATFHEEVAKNRRDYLANEVERLEREQEQNREQLEQLGAQRQRDLELLTSRGALDDLTHLQQQLASSAAAAEGITQEINKLREMRKHKASLKTEQIVLQQRTELDVRQRLPAIERILEDFSDTFEETYGEIADLTVHAGAAGYRFGVALPRHGSHGVGKISIFAYDLAVTNAWARKGKSLGFLGHDSVILDGVDERQKSAAIRRVLRDAEQNDFQYILTMNSDDLPITSTKGQAVDLAEFTILTLTDSDPSGGLLGIRV